MSNSASAATAKPSSSVKLVLLGEAAVGKVSMPDSPLLPLRKHRSARWLHHAWTSQNHLPVSKFERVPELTRT